MPAIYHPGVIETAAHYDIGAPHDAVNVLHWLTPTPSATLAELTTVQTTFNTWWNQLWAGLGSTVNGYKGCIVTDMGSNTGLQVRNDTYVRQAGTVTGGTMGDQVALLISLKTAIRYRGGHGRVYVPGLGMGAVNNDGRTVESSHQTATDTAWTQLVSHMGAITIGATAGLSPIVWHKKLTSAPNTTEVVIAGITQTVLATQRRRLRKVSRHKKRVP